MALHEEGNVRGSFEGGDEWIKVYGGTGKPNANCLQKAAGAVGWDVSIP